MNNINIFEKNIEDRKKLIEKLMENPQQNKKAIENANKYITKTQRKLKNAKITYNQSISSSNNKKPQQKTTKETEQIMIDTSERKAISIKIKVGVLNALKKEHHKYQTLINAILESYVINKNLN